MQIKELNWYSERLHRDMPVKVYGHDGKSCLVIPSQDGKHNDFEGFGMVEPVPPLLKKENSASTVSIPSMQRPGHVPGRMHCDRIVLHEDWMQYLVQEVLPLMEKENKNQKAMTMGCSMGAFHAANLFFRFPDRFDTTICLSGIYDASQVLGGYMDDLVYLNSPYHCLQNMPEDHPYMSLYRRSNMFFCVGQGAWEDELLADTRKLDGVLHAKGIPAFVDYWGYDVAHDWNWWQKQAPYFLGKIL